MSGLLKLSASLLPRSLPGAATLVRTGARYSATTEKFRGRRIPTPEGATRPAASLLTGKAKGSLRRVRADLGTSGTPGTERTPRNGPGAPGLEKSRVTQHHSRAILKKEKENRSVGTRPARICRRSGSARIPLVGIPRRELYNFSSFTRRRRGARRGGINYVRCAAADERSTRRPEAAPRNSSPRVRVSRGIPSRGVSAEVPHPGVETEPVSISICLAVARRPTEGLLASNGVRSMARYPARVPSRDTHLRRSGADVD